MFAFGVLLGIAMAALDGGKTETGYAAVGIALVPLIPLLVGFIMYCGYIKVLDELQQKIQFESLLMAALGVSGIALVAGLLEACELIPHVPALWVPVLLISLWGCASLAVKQKYR